MLFPTWLVGPRLADPPICCPQCPADAAVPSKQMDTGNSQVIKVLAVSRKQYPEGQSERRTKGWVWGIAGNAGELRCMMKSSPG